jgi:hypothetical protein
LAGLYFIAKELAETLKTGSDEKAWPNVSIRIQREGLEIAAPDEQLKPFVEACYEDLAKRWWNQSTSEQEQKKEQVLFDRQSGEFKLAAKQMPTPVAALSVGGSSWRSEGILYDDLDDTLREACDQFLQETGRKLYGAKKELLYEQPVCHPKLDIFPTKGKKRVCSVCGQHTVCMDVSQTAFPLFSSKSATFSFNPDLGAPAIICWECDMLGKFAVHAAQYRVSSPYTHIMQLKSPDLRVLIDNCGLIGCASPMRSFDPHTVYFSNFEKKHSILQNALLPYEVLWGFYIAAYELLLQNQRDRKNQEETEDEELGSEELEKTASLGAVLMSVAEKGKTFITREVIDYNDTTYIFRLINSVTKEAKEVFVSRSEKFWDGLFYDFFILMDPRKKFDPTNGLYRNRIVQKVLEKSSILQDVESFVFEKSQKTDYPQLDRILLFVKQYELIINHRDTDDGEGKGMTKEQIETAAKLGTQIILSAKEVLREGDGRGDLKAIKGDLFTLRKTRTIVDFLEQLNRLQFRYGIILNKEIIDGMLEDVDFEDFKAYCMISALNAFNREMRSHAPEKQQAEEQSA